ncbi:MAG TPA: TonB-dependent receptor [Flavitalea sp.]|nr:TonB-dependent receptor [Flavitalea sp.]
MRSILTIILLITITTLTAQQPLSTADSSDVLEQVVVKGYEYNRKLIDVPAPIAVISKAQFNRYNNISLLPALNTVSGVRMEERSPGSYRLNIRGSSLRSPFGVRNVKVYYNNIPYTDPGGNTFFNQLGFYNINSMEIIKGPGSSIYGAGTGGVILLNSNENNFQKGANFDFSTGSFNTYSVHGNIKGGTEDLNHSINLQYQQSDGYRVQTKMDRKVISWDGKAKVGDKGILRAHFLQGDLYYQTPGALTLAEFTANPKAARPATGPNPSAVDARAAIFQKLYVAGLNYSLVWNNKWQNNTTLYGAYSRLINPTVRNFETRTEPHFGSRTVIQYNDSINRTAFTWIGGAEAQQGFGTSKVYTNKQGNADSLLTNDEIETHQWSLFTQASLEMPHDWTITGGISFNILNVQIQRFASPASLQRRKYNNELAPRLAVLKKIFPSVSLYGSIAKGYSPPTNAELLPSTGVVNANLEAETGLNYEAGIRGRVLNNRLYFDVNTFYFRLHNTISQRRDQAGADFFVNAGKTKQKGIETFATYRIVDNKALFFQNVSVWASNTFHDFHYDEFEKITDDTADYSGNRLPSIPKHFVSAGIDLVTKAGLYANVTYYYSDPIPLNDANSNYASSYNLASIRIGLRRVMTERFSFDLFGTADNLFDVKYSLGNDINAFGGRYYNAAPERNFAVGASLRYVW